MDARKDEDAMILLIVPDKYIVHIDQPFDSGSARTREKLLEIAAAEHEGIVRDYYFLGHAGEREPRAVPLVFRKLHVIMHVIAGYEYLVRAEFIAYADDRSSGLVDMVTL